MKTTTNNNGKKKAGAQHVTQEDKVLLSTLKQPSTIPINLRNSNLIGRSPPLNSVKPRESMYPPPTQTVSKSAFPWEKRNVSKDQMSRLNTDIGLTQLIQIHQ